MENKTPNNSKEKNTGSSIESEPNKKTPSHSRSESLTEDKQKTHHHREFPKIELGAFIDFGNDSLVKRLTLNKKKNISTSMKRLVSFSETEQKEKHEEGHTPVLPSLFSKSSHNYSKIFDISKLKIKAHQLRVRKISASRDLTSQAAKQREELDTLYKDVHREWMSKVSQPQDLKNIYFLALQCILYPVLSASSLLSQFLTRDFKLLRDAFQIDANTHKQVLNEASNESNYVLCLLLQQIQNLDKDAIYNINNFQNLSEFAIWKQKTTEKLNYYIKKLEEEPEFVGQLLVNVLEGRDLAIKDESTSDPFCVLVLINNKKAQITAKTQVIPKTLDPVWIEEFRFPVDSKFKNSSLKIVVWDKDKYTTNDYMGEVTIPLSSLDEKQLTDQWFTLGVSKERSKEKVSGDIHLTLQLNFRKKSQKTSHQPLFSTSLTEIQRHRYFQELAFKLFQIQNPNLKDETAPMKPFSTRDISLLNEYCLRYGIVDYYKNLTLLDIYLTFLRMNLGCLLEILNVLIAIESIQETSLPMNKEEANMYSKYLFTLQEKLKTKLISYKQENDIDAINILLKILYRTCGKKQKDFDSLLLSVIPQSAEYAYQTMRNKLNEENFFELLPHLIENIEKERLIFSEIFPKNIDLISLNVPKYMELLQQDVQMTFFQKEYVSANTFDTYFAIEHLNQYLKDHFLNISVFPVEINFEPLLIRWIDQLQNKLGEWNQRMIQVDQWEPMDEKAAEPVLHSTSIIDLFNFFTEALNFLLSVNFKREQNISYFVDNVMASGIEFYSINMVKISIEAISLPVPIDACNDLAVILKTKKRTCLEFYVNKPLCVRLNNLNIALYILTDTAQTIEDKIVTISSDTFSHCFFVLKRDMDKLMNIILTKMNTDIQMILEYYFETSLGPNPTPKTIEPLFTYLNLQLITFSDYLYASLFQKLIGRIFKLVIKNLELILLPFEFSKSDRINQAKLVDQIVDKIVNFFHANGEGVSNSFVEKNLKTLRMALSLFSKSTSELIANYSRDGVSLEEQLATLSVLQAHTKDKTAEEFVKKHSQNIFHRKLRGIFELELEEEIIAKFLCTDVEMHGAIYVTTSFICFEPLLGKNKFKIPLLDIDEVHKVNSHNFLPNALEIVAKGSSIRILGILDRNGCHKKIIEAANKKGNKKLESSSLLSTKPNQNETQASPHLNSSSFSVNSPNPFKMVFSKFSKKS